VATANAASTTAVTAYNVANAASSAAIIATGAANTASSAAATAVTTANTASATAANALSVANTASSTAGTAIATANTASSAAATAVATANTASTTAANAQSVANTASSTAGAAVTTANTASSTAVTAYNVANAARSAAVIATGLATDAYNLASAASSGSTFEFNVKAYGAKGNGVNDDTASIQNAFNACVAAGSGNVLRIPPGTYKITSQLTFLASGIAFNIIATGARLLWTSNSATTAVVIGAYAGMQIERCNFTGIAIYNASPNWGINACGLEIVNTRACSFDDVSVEGFRYGIILHGNDAGNVYDKLGINAIRNCQYGLTPKITNTGGGGLQTESFEFSVKPLGVIDGGNPPPIPIPPSPASGSVGGGYLTGSGGIVGQWYVLGGMWDTGLVNSAQYNTFRHINFTAETSGACNFIFEDCAFVGGFNNWTSSVSGFAFWIENTNITINICHFEFVDSNGAHYPGYGILGPLSVGCKITHHSFDLNVYDYGTSNEIWCFDKMNYAASGSTAIQAPTFYGLVGINAVNSDATGLYVARNPRLTGFVPDPVVKIDTTNLNDTSVGLNVVTGLGDGIRAKTLSGVPIVAEASNSALTSVAEALTLTHSVTGADKTPTAGSFGVGINFNLAVAGTGVPYTYATQSVIGDNTTTGTRVGRFIFSTNYGEVQVVGLQITNALGAAKLGFFGADPSPRPEVTGTYLTTAESSTLSALAQLGLILNSTTPVKNLDLSWTPETSGVGNRFYVGSTDVRNSQVGVYAESGSNVPIYAKGGTGAAYNLYMKSLSDTNNSERTQFVLANEFVGAGSVANNFGSNIVFYSTIGEARSSLRRQFMLRSLWASAATGNPRSRFQFYAYYGNSTAVEILRGETDGTNAQIGFLGNAAVTKRALSGRPGDSSATISIANALKDLGLATSTVTTSGQTLIASAISSNTTLSADKDIAFCTGTITVTLPPCANIATNNSHTKVFYVVNKGTGTVTIAPSGSSTINGGSSLTLTANQSATLVSDGSNWFTL